MRFISRSQAFKKSVIKAKQTIVNTDQGPEYVTTQPPYIALFEQGGATNAEIKLALEKFQFKGLGERENPARRISIFDTDEQARRYGWSAEFKAEVEKALVEGQNLDYFLVEAPRVPVPWPAYNQTPPAKVLEIALSIGVEPSHVLAYERENKNRATVVKLLEESVEPNEVVVEA